MFAPLRISEGLCDHPKAMTKKRLAIISTHPIQYYAPIFREMAQGDAIQPRVFYTWSQSASGNSYDAGFGTSFGWDIPLLTGYDYEFVDNVSKQPGTESFFGIRNPGLCTTVSAWRPDAILVYGWNNLSHLNAMRYFKGRVPVFFRGDSTLLDPRSPWRNLVRRNVLRRIYRNVDFAISVGSNSRDYFRWCGLLDDQIGFAPHAIDNRRFSVSDKTVNQTLQWRRELGIPAEAITIVFAGKLIPKKAPGLLLDAFIKSGIAAHLIYVGNGSLEEQLVQAAKGHMGVHFMPFQNQSSMPAVYQLADVFVLPSCGPGETWGLALNEAMASGKAVIASSRVGGARDIVCHGVNGWTFESGNLGALIDVLSQAMQLGKEGLSAMGKSGQKLIESWSTEASALKTAEFIAGEIRRRSHPAR